MTDLAALLRELRKSRGYSLRQVERMSNGAVSHGYLHLLEKGYDSRTGKPIAPSAKILEKLAQVYEYPYQEMLRVAGYLPPAPGTSAGAAPLDLEEIMRQNEILFDGEVLSPRDKADLLRVMKAVWGVLRGCQG